MATIRNISMPSRSVTTIICPIASTSLLLGLGNEADASDAGIGGVGHHLRDRLILRGAIGPQVDLRLRLALGRRGEALAQAAPVDVLAVPVERAVGPDRQGDVLGPRQVRLARSLGEVELDRVG